VDGSPAHGEQDTDGLLAVLQVSLGFALFDWNTEKSLFHSSRNCEGCSLPLKAARNCRILLLSVFLRIRTLFPFEGTAFAANLKYTDNSTVGGNLPPVWASTQQSTAPDVALRRMNERRCSIQTLVERGLWTSPCRQILPRFTLSREYFT